MATETGSQSNAKVILENARQDRDQLQRKYDDEMKQLESDLTPAGLKVTSLDLKPQKGDIEVSDVSLVWLPVRISGAGAAEAVYLTTDK
jgi:hypothetical protein